ncbi:DUF6247 family protein [Nocardiopsis kunsanensis]|uniref:DUF6247 family protein n=1 Tax=Nocardiopsis kunsanensis TaxID=141693 RepID=UPI000477D65F|nr:DUF6247 family protein [Nocardiopsis kunsanensis]
MTPPRAGHSPKEIRDALLPEGVGDFDSEFRRVMDDAKERLDLTALHEFLEHWRWIAISSQDPEAHRHMIDVADRLERGENVPATPWSEAKKQMGL